MTRVGGPAPASSCAGTPLGRGLQRGPDGHVAIAVVSGSPTRAYSAVFPDSCPCSRGLAPALLMTVAMLSSLFASACFNPRLIGSEQARENHVPVVEVFPAPSNVPIPADVGGQCAPAEISIVALDDADDDPLTVRFDILSGSRARRRFLQQSPPIPPIDNGYPLNALTTLKLDETTLGDVTPGDVDTQLVELRVSDDGFAADINGNPVAGDGGGLFFMSWIVRIAPCPGAE